MKSLTRTIIVLVIINLTMGNFTLAQEAAGEPQRPRLSRRGVPMPTKPEPIGTASTESPAEPVPDVSPELRGAPVAETAAPVPPMSPARPYPIRENRLSHISSRKVLVIPTTDVKAEGLVAITEDLQVMSHIFDERFKEPREIKGAFVDFGDFFGRNRRSTEAIYIQNYGVLFLMEVNFAFSPAPKPKEQEAQETEEYVDPDWQRAKQKLFSPKGFGGSDLVPEEQYSADKIEQIKTELIRTLKHAANIRNIKPDEWIILTVIGQARQTGGMYEDYYRSVTPRTGTSTSRRRSSSRSGSGMYGGGMGGGYGVSGRTSGRMGGRGGTGGVMMGGGMMGGMGAMYGEDYSETGPASATVLTIRVKKNDVDAFRMGLDFEQFQEKVEIFTY
jgi:hypothetical protein